MLELCWGKHLQRTSTNIAGWHCAVQLLLYMICWNMQKQHAVYCIYAILYVNYILYGRITMVLSHLYCTIVESQWYSLSLYCGDVRGSWSYMLISIPSPLISMALSSSWAHQLLRGSNNVSAGRAVMEGERFSQYVGLGYMNQEALFKPYSRLYWVEQLSSSGFIFPAGSLTRMRLKQKPKPSNSLPV